MSAHHRSRRAELALAVVLIATVSVSFVGHGQGQARVPVGLVAPADSESTSLYCTGLTGVKGLAPANVLFANTTTATREVVATVSANHSATRHFTFSIPPLGQFTMRSTVFPGASFFGVSALVSGGGVAAVVHGTLAGASTSPCVSSGSTSWSVSGLSTKVNYHAIVTLLNPTATSSVVKLTVWSPSGFAAPQQFQSVVVGPRSEVALDVGTQIVNTKDVAVVVTALEGTVVVAAIEAWNNNSTGDSVATGSDAGTSMYFPNAPTNDRARTVLALANTSDQLAHVSIDVSLSPYSVAPFSLDVAAQSVADVIISPASRVPAAGAASLHLQSSAPIVATEVTQVSSLTGQWLTAPATLSWVQIEQPDSPGGFSTASFMNPNDRSVTVQIIANPLGGATAPAPVTLTIPASGVRTVGASFLATWRKSVVVVTSSDPIAVAATYAGALSGALIENGSGGR